METTIGKYRLGRVLGSGGMGRVFAAHDTVLEREVALKRMHGTAQASPEARERFAREARAIAALRHPNVVQIYDHGLADDGSLYTVMELLEGEDLGHRLGRVTSLTPGAFAPILVQIAAALDAAHSARIVHRDLKPENVFITSHGTECVVKILDFGVASIQGQLATKDSHLTRQNQLLGTPAYMSPEQAEGLAVDHRSDLWSLGAIAYQALTGRLPFRGENAVATLIRICTREPEPPTSLVASLPRELDRFFARALCKDPGGRFQSAREMSAAFLEIFPGNAAQGPIKILAVDDEPDVRSLLEQYFQEQIDSGRYQFMFASDGQSALKVLEEHPEVHVALTDLNMPGMNGLTLLAEFERIAPALRAVVLSAYGDLPNIRQAMNRGAFDFLVKPIDLGDLEITLEKAATVARQMSRAFHSLEENRTLKSFIDPALLRHILPIMRSASGGLGECAEATVAVIGFPDLAKRLRQAVDEALGVGRMDVLQQTHQHLNASFDTALALLAAHDGSAVRFDGGYLVASFRGPEQLERAVRACVQIRDTLPIHQATTGGVHLGSVSSGIACGTTVSGIIGAPSRQRFDHALIGGAVATAHSLFMAALPGEILLPEQLAEKLRLHFPYLPEARVQPSPSVPTACVALKAGWLPDHRASAGHEPTVNL